MDGGSLMPDLSKLTSEELLDLAEKCREGAYRRKSGKPLPPRKRPNRPMMHPGEAMVLKTFSLRKKHYEMFKAAAGDEGKATVQLLREIMQEYLENIGYL